MHYSVIIGDTEGRAKSLSRSSSSVLKQKGEGVLASRCVRNRVRVFVRHVVVRVSRAYVFVDAGISRAPVYQDTRQQRKTLSGRGKIRIYRAGPIKRIWQCAHKSKGNLKFYLHSFEADLPRKS